MNSKQDLKNVGVVLTSQHLHSMLPVAAGILAGACEVLILCHDLRSSQPTPAHDHDLGRLRANRRPLLYPGKQPARRQGLAFAQVSP